jgi:glycosyltransferase involved in cell wall biosynthesis
MEMKKFTSQAIRKFVSAPRFDEKIFLNKDHLWPKISIVIPSYNQEEFLERTILSVLNQNYPNLELIIIDGGSTDGSTEMIKKYEMFLTHWVSEPDQGQASAIKKGFTKTTGEIMAWLNSDDMYLPGTLSAVAEVFGNDNTVDLVYGNGYHVDTEDTILGELRYTPFHFPTLLYSATMMQAATFWKRNIYFNTGGINDSYRFSMDYDLLLRMTKNGTCKHLRRYLSCFRIHGNQKTHVIAHVGKEEHDLIRRSFLSSNPGKMLKCAIFWRRYCTLRRALFYLRQGDGDYFVKGICRRFTGKKHQKSTY